jgi:hypothetical protein
MISLVHDFIIFHIWNIEFYTTFSIKSENRCFKTSVARQITAVIIHTNGLSDLAQGKIPSHFLKGTV